MGDEAEANASLISPEILRGFREVTSYPTREEIISSFNSYVRGPLRERVLSFMGREVDVPFKLCAVCTLPLSFLGVILVMDCGGHTDCESSLLHEGYPSVYSYLTINITMNMVMSPLIYSFMWPLTLRANHLVSTAMSRKAWQIVFGTFSSFCVSFFVNALQAFYVGVTVVVVNKYSSSWLGIFLGANALVCWLAASKHLACFLFVSLGSYELYSWRSSRGERGKNNMPNRSFFGGKCRRHQYYIYIYIISFSLAVFGALPLAKVWILFVRSELPVKSSPASRCVMLA